MRVVGGFLEWAGRAVGSTFTVGGFGGLLRRMTAMVERRGFG